MDFHHQWIVLLVRIYAGVECAEPTPPSLPFPPRSLYLLSWPPRSSPWSSCGRQQPGQWAAPADTRPGQQLPTEPPGGTRCSDLKQRAEGERGQRGESLIIHSCRAKIRAQVSPLYPSPLFHHLTILLLRVRCHKKKSRIIQTAEVLKHNTMTLMVIVAIIVSISVHHLRIRFDFQNQWDCQGKQKPVWTFVFTCM